MANPVIINPSLTLAGQEAAFNADNTGIALKLTHVSFGRAHYDPNGSEVNLRDPVGSRIPLAGGSRPTPYQLRTITAWSENVGDVPVGEIAWWAGSVLVWVWSRASGEVAVHKTNGVTYVMFADCAFTSAPENSVSFVIDPSANIALAALAEHEGSDNAHPQYLLRREVAQDSGPLAYLTTAGSTANALVLDLADAESELEVLRAGQRFQFLAPLTNTGPVTAEVADFAPIAVKRGGDGGLVQLEAGDIKAGSLYDLNYDGTFFQLGGGVGSGKAFERFSFVAGVAQTVFPVAHVPGNLIALRNGREIYDFTSASDGSKVTTAQMNFGDRMEFLTFRSFKVADSYTKAEIHALLATAGSVPVGTMLPFPVDVIPPGYVVVDGGLYPDALYPELTAFLGKKYNLPGDPAGQTRKPESRGEFFRGADHGRGIDPGRAVGTYQGEDYKRHAHREVGFVDGVAGQIGATGVIGAAVTASIFGKVFGRAAVAGAKSYRETAPGSISGGGDDGSGAGGLTSGDSGGEETRPRNLAVLWCIKAWSSPINQGTIDIGALSTRVEANEFGRLLNIRKFTANGTYIPTPGMKRVRVRMEGGSGGSAGVPATGVGQYALTGGSGAGSYAEALLTAADIGVSQPVVIGQAGAAGAPAANGGNGGATSLGSLVSAPGSPGGPTYPLFFMEVGGMAPQGIGGALPSGGNIINSRGADGGSAISIGGGTLSGRGGDSRFGSGGSATGLSEGGTRGVGYGAGSSGIASPASTPARPGIQGLPGIMIIEEYA